MVTIRLAAADDYAAVCSLYSYYFTRMSELLPDVFVRPSDKVFSRKEYGEFISDEGARLYIAFDTSGAPAGLLALSLSNHGQENAFFTDQTRQYVDDLIVLPPYEKNGLASLLISKAEEVARENGIEWVSSVTYPALPGNAQAFEKNGYSPLSVRVQKRVGGG